MINSIKSTIEHQWAHWVRRRANPGSTQRLDAHNLYIIPSAFGWAYALVVLSLFFCAINYQVSAVFFLTFLLAVAGMFSALEGHFNLKSLSVDCLSLEDVYQGDVLKVILSINSGARRRYSLIAQLDAQEKITREMADGNDGSIILTMPTVERGCFKLPTITISSYFPLGLFKVWGYIYFDSSYYVYPRSRSQGYWPESSDDSGSHSSVALGDEEMYELKQVANPWVQSTRIAWKIAARGQGWFLKTMTNMEGKYWIFRLQTIASPSREEDLQHLCYWLQQAEQKGYFYAVELNGKRSDISKGPDHLRHCLRLLAIY